MAYVLPVGPGAGFGDISQSAPPGPPPTDPASTIGSEGGAASDINGSQSTWTQSETNGPQSFQDALKSSQKSGPTAGKPTAKARPADIAALVAPTLALPLAAGIHSPLAVKAAAKDSAISSSASTDPKESATALAAAKNDGRPSLEAVDLKEASAAPAAMLAAAPDAVSEASASGAVNTAQFSAQSKAKTAESQVADSSASTESEGNSHALAPSVQTLAQSDMESAKSALSQGGGSRQDSQGGSGSGSPGTSAQYASAAASNPSTVPSPLPADAKIASASLAERVSVIRQIAEQVSAAAPAATTGSQSVTVNVHPDHWGELTINLTMNPASSAARGAGDGAVTATIVAQSDAVRDALQSQVKELQDSLQSAGIKLQKIDIITAGAAAGTVAAGHSASQSGFSPGSQNNSHGHDARSRHMGASPQGSPGDQGQRSQQQFAALFGGADDGASLRLPNLASVASAAPEPLTPIGLVQATSAAAAGGVNVLA